MEKFCIRAIEAIALFVFILSFSFLAYSLFILLPSWTVIFTYGIPLFACGEIYNLFEKLRLFIPIVMTAVLLMIFTVLSFFVFDFPLGLNFILCIQTAGAVAYSIHIRKKLKNTYSGSFPIAYKRNCDIVYNSCAAFIMAFDGDHSDRILSSFIAFIEDDFEPFPEFSSRHANLNSLMLRTLDHVLIQLASEPRFYHSRKDNDDWHGSNDTLIGGVAEIYKKVQTLYEKDFSEACRKWAKLVELVNSKYADSISSASETPEARQARRIREANERVLPSL